MVIPKHAYAILLVLTSPNLSDIVRLDVAKVVQYVFRRENIFFISLKDLHILCKREFWEIIYPLAYLQAGTLWTAMSEITNL